MSEVRAGEVEVATPPPIKAPKGPGRGPMPKGMTFPAYAKKHGAREICSGGAVQTGGVAGLCRAAAEDADEVDGLGG